MEIATNLPLLPEEVGIVILKRTNTTNTSLHRYSVQRRLVENALNGLCYGFPTGGTSTHSTGFAKYDEPDHINRNLNGRYFLYLPNPYYNDVVINTNKLVNLPATRQQLALKVIDVDENINEDDKGPSEEQFTLIDDNKGDNDQNVTMSAVACPLPPKDTQQEPKALIDKLAGRSGAAKDVINPGGSVASVNWNYVQGDAIKELNTEGFFTMAFPTIFINGSCDCKISSLRGIEYNEFVSHIYYNVDNRVSQHRFLKFVLLNLGLRQIALSQGSFVVAQQLLDFDTMSCAEYHCTPLLNIIIDKTEGIQQ